MANRKETVSTHLKSDLLILDEFNMKRLSTTSVYDLLEIIQRGG
jgi:DNA replication protein DnaC